MKKTAVILTRFLLTMFIAMLLFPQTTMGGVQPSITDISLSHSSQNVMAANNVEITVNTVNAPRLTTVTAQLVQGASGLPVSGVGIKSGYIIDNSVKIKMDMPTSLKAGIYKIKAAMYIGGILNEKTAEYKIYPVNIPAPALVPQSHKAGSAQTVTVTIFADVINGTEATVSLQNNAGNAVSGVASGLAKFSGSRGEAVITIPSNVVSGTYRVEVDILGVSDSSTVYSILESSGTQPQEPGGEAATGPLITDIRMSGSSMAEGSVNGAIIISGSNFSPDTTGNSVNIINNTTGLTTFSQLTPAEASATYLKVLLPGSIKEGIYTVKVTTGGKSASSLTPFSIEAPEPLIEAIEFSQDAGLVFGSISGNITIKGKNFSSAIAQNALQFTDETGNVKASSIVSSSSSTAITAPLPINLTTGYYKVRVTLGNKSVTSSEGFTVYSNASMLAMPQITGISLSKSPLAAGSIEGNIIISGTGFTSGSKVYLTDSSSGVTSAVAAVSSVTSMKITAPVPANIAPGNYRVKVVNGTAYDISETIITIMGPLAVGGSGSSGGSIGTGGIGGSSGMGGGGAGTGGSTASGETTSTKTKEKINELTKAAEKLAGSGDAAEVLSNAKQIIEDTAGFINTARTAGESIGEIEAALLKIANTAIDKVNSQSLLTQAAGNRVNTVVSQEMAGTLITKIKEIAETARQLNSSLNSAGTGVKVDAILKLNLTSGKKANAVDISLPATVLKEASDKGLAKIVISSDVASVSIHPGFVSIKGAGTVELKSEKLDTGKLNENIRKAAGNDAVYDFNLMVDGVSAGKFAKAVEVSLPYQLRQGEDLRKLTVFYINDKGELENVIGRYDSVNETVRFTTDHFSKYIIRYNTVSFNDTGKYKWAEEYIGVMASKGILNGVGGGKFNPSANLTRAEFVTIVTSALKLVDENAASNFSDVARNAWYYKYVSSAVKLGIVSGRLDGTFAPDDKISRQDMAVILANTLIKAKGYELPYNSDAILKAFNDRDKIGGYAKKAVSLIYKNSIITGKPGGLFDPRAFASRAEAAVVIYRLFFLE